MNIIVKEKKNAKLHSFYALFFKLTEPKNMSIRILEIKGTNIWIIADFLCLYLILYKELMHVINIGRKEVKRGVLGGLDIG